MFNIPDRYKKELKLKINDAVPKDLKPNEKKKYKEVIKSITLMYQIEGEEISSIIEANYRCQAIMFFDVLLNDVKNASFVAKILQKKIKEHCILRLHDTKEEVYSFALKRLDKQDNNEIVVESELLTEKYMVSILTEKKEYMEKYMDFEAIKNKQDKICLYREWYCKAYLVTHYKAYRNINELLDCNIWYSYEKAESLYNDFSQLVIEKEKVKNALTNSQKTEHNKNIRGYLDTIRKKYVKIL